MTKKFDHSSAPAITGRSYERKVQHKHGLPIKGTTSNYPWEYMWHQERWSFAEARNGFFPNLSFFHHSPGVGGIQNNGAGRSQAIAALSQRGWTVIPWDHPDLGLYGNYLREYPLANGRMQYVSQFQSPRVMGNRTVWTVDTEGYNDFLDFLQDARIVKPMDPYIKEYLIRKQTQRIGVIEGDLFANPGHKMMEVRLQREQRRLALMRGEDVDTAMDRAKAVAEAALKVASAKKG